MGGGGGGWGMQMASDNSMQQHGRIPLGLLLVVLTVTLLSWRQLARIKCGMGGDLMV